MRRSNKCYLLVLVYTSEVSRIQAEHIVRSPKPVSFARLSYIITIGFTLQTFTQRNRFNMSLLDISASRHDAVAVTKLLLSSGFVAEDPFLGFPLMVATRYNNVELVQVLVDNGAKTRLTEALDYAELHRNNRVAMVLSKAIAL